MPSSHIWSVADHLRARWSHSFFRPRTSVVIALMWFSLSICFSYRRTRDHAVKREALEQASWIKQDDEDELSDTPHTFSTLNSNRTVITTVYFASREAKGGRRGFGRSTAVGLASKQMMGTRMASEARLMQIDDGAKPSFRSLNLFIFVMAKAIVLASSGSSSKY